MKTYNVTSKDIDRKWYIVDARDKVFGRLATRIVNVLRGKHKPDYSPSMGNGDFVVVINADKVKVTGKKMKDKVDEYSKLHNIKVTLEESPAESAIERLYNIDKITFFKAIKRLRHNYYTNSIHFRVDAPIDILERIEKQSKFHTLIESGAIIHVYVGEHLPPASSIFSLIKKVYDNTETAQITITPEFTLCKDCNFLQKGLTNQCKCGSINVEQFTRIVGYMSKVGNWNDYKKEELVNRKKEKI